MVKVCLVAVSLLLCLNVMRMKNIPISEAISYGWKKFWEKWQLLFSLSVLVGLINLAQQLTSKGTTGAFFLGLLFIVLSLYISIGTTKISLRVVDGESPEFLDVFRSAKYFLRCLGAGFLIGITVMLGFMLLIVPGIIWGVRYSQVLNLIVDKDMKIIDAMRKSGELTRGVKGQLILFYLACVGVMILGAIALAVGVLIAMPVVWLATVFVYRHLLKQGDTGVVASSQPAPPSPATTVTA